MISGPDERGNYYKLRGLHNNHMHDEIAVSRLKLYSAITDVDRLAPDESLCSQIVTKVNNLLTYVSKHV